MTQIDTYKQNTVESQTPGRIVVMLYDGAVKFLHKAIEECEAGNPEAKGEAVGRALDIIVELDSVLDMEVGGEVAENLRAMYAFMTRHINTAHINNDVAMFKEVITLLEELNDGWKAISS